MAAKLRLEPYRFEFFQAVRLLERLFPESAPVATFVHPDREVVHFGAHASLAFPASEIQALEWPDAGPLRMTVNFMGLTGPEGVLPIPYTSLVLDRLRASDTSLQDFLDLFNHRTISLFYQAWKQRRCEVVFRQEEEKRTPHQLLSLVGLGTDGLQARQAVPDEALVFYAGLLAQRPRPAQALRQILADYFQVPVEIEQFSGDWYALDRGTQCCLSEGVSESERLGVGAVVGDAVWSQQSKVRIVLGPLDLDCYMGFLPGGAYCESLHAWIRFFSNDGLDFEVNLILKRALTPACELGGDGPDGPRLGWISWLKSRPMDRDPADTVLSLQATYSRLQ